MKLVRNSHLFVCAALCFFISPQIALAQSDGDPLPPPFPFTATPTDRVDHMLDRMLPHMIPDPDAVDQAAEQNVTREINVSRSVGQMLRPVGFVSIGNKKMIYASEDGQRVMKLSPGGRIGIMKIKEITEDGVSYMAAKKEMYAPLSFLPSDPPEPPKNSSNTSKSTPQASAAPTNGR